MQQRLENLRIKLGIPISDVANILGHPGGALGYVVLLDGDLPMRWEKLTPYYVFALRFLIHAWNVDGAKARGPKMVAMRNSYAAITFESLGIEPSITTGTKQKKPAREHLAACLTNQQAMLDATDDPVVREAIKQRMAIIASVNADHLGRPL